MNHHYIQLQQIYDQFNNYYQNEDLADIAIINYINIELVNANNALAQHRRWLVIYKNLYGDNYDSTNDDETIADLENKIFMMNEIAAYILNQPKPHDIPKTDR
jgi:hypothetical protein